MPQSQNLSLERSLTSKDSSNRGKQQDSDLEHGSGKLQRQLSKFN
jgi:hypothetical protein